MVLQYDQIKTQGMEPITVSMSIEEFDKFRLMEKAILERKHFRIWKDNGQYGNDYAYMLAEESEAIKELNLEIEGLRKRINEMYLEKRELSKKLNIPKPGENTQKSEEKSKKWWGL